MNKLTKVGCSALCGSLAAISAANAGDLTVTGGADLTWVSLSDDSTGNPMGMGSNITFKGSGELDNGWTVDLTIANTNANAYSSTVINVGMGGLGSINFNQGDSGNGVAAMDDKMPTAWEEPWGAGLTTGIRTVMGAGASQNIQYSTPTLFGTTIKLAYAPEFGASDTADKTTSGITENGLGRAYDATININPSLGTEILSGLNLFAGAATIEHTKANSSYDNDLYDGVIGMTFDFGPVSIGQQWSGEYLGEEGRTGEVGVINTYKSKAFGIAFNVNDDLSISYGEHRSRKAGGTGTDLWATLTNENQREVSVESIQAAYTMGGASLRVANVTASNVGFSSGTNRDATIVSLGLAF